MKLEFDQTASSASPAPMGNRSFSSQRAMRASISASLRSHLRTIGDNDAVAESF